MKYYFINTDAKSLGGVSPHNKWFATGFAFTGGPIGYGEKLRRFNPGDLLLMYANGLGVVAVGAVLEPWEGREHRPQMVYTRPYEDKEYRIPVRWFLDLRERPITAEKLKKTIGWNPSSAVQEVQKGVEKIQQLIKRLEREKN
jgi:hypothetical protein